MKEKALHLGRHLLLLFSLAVLAFVLLFTLKKDSGEILATSKALSEEEEEDIRNSSQYQSIIESTDIYPASFIEDLKRNPEILEFLENYPTAEHVATGGITSSDAGQKCPLFIQWDSRWGYVDYGNNVVGISGCGPTCVAMVTYALTHDSNISPDVVASYAMENDYYVDGIGTAWALLEDYPAQYEISCHRYDSMTFEDVVKTLDEGGYLICSVGPGDFTDTGHFIVISGYNSDELEIKDPFSYTNSSKTWSFDTIKNQTKSFWTYNLQ